MPEKQQELREPIGDDSLNMEPACPEELFVVNIVRRCFAFCFGWFGNKVKRLITDALGRLRVSPSDTQWVYEAAGDAVTGDVLQHSLIALPDTKYRRVTICAAGQTVLWTLIINGIGCDLYTGSQTGMVIVEGYITDVLYQAIVAGALVSALVQRLPD